LVAKRKRYLKKETLGRNIVRSVAGFDPHRLCYLDQLIGQVYDVNKEIVDKHQDQMQKLDELFHEFTNNPSAFVKKYAELDNNQVVLRFLKDNTDLFKGRYWT
jgi:hypothetical protein